MLTIGKGVDVLLINDDGYTSSGFVALKEALQSNGLSVACVVPYKNQTGVGGAIDRLDVKKIPVINQSVNEVVLDCTPVNCLRWGIKHMKISPKLIICGINQGLNTIKNLPSSATIMSCVYAGIQGFDALAISAEDNSKRTLDIAINFIIKHFQSIGDGAVLSLNIPKGNSPYVVSVHSVQQESLELSKGNSTLRILNYTM